MSESGAAEWDEERTEYYGTACTPAEYAKEEVRRTLKWFEEAKKEVKSEMELQLIDVIFFNKKTKVIDYRENIVAADTEEAYILAAQDYREYDVKVHIRRANCILSFKDDYVELPE